MKPYYQRAGVTIYHADYRDVLPSLPTVDLLLTDPPYELQARGAGMAANRKYLRDIKGELDCGFDVSLLTAFPNWFCFCSKDQLISLLEAANVLGGGRWMLLTWNKPNPTPLMNANYLPDTEYIVHRFESAKRLFGDYSARSRFIVWPAEKNEFEHPTVKPLQVVKKLVTLGTQPGDTILDPFMGTGTTLRAAKDLGRAAIGVEVEERYCEIAAHRLAQDVLFS